ncbi:MAG: inositol monophosphatase [Parcubacteria group bacterium]|nr:inositol monophosphatase [Parcubacteria group bacterium]
MKKQSSIIKAAKEGGKVLSKYFGKNLKTERKSTKADLRTVADTESEKAILKILKKEFPEYNIWSEERDYIDKKSEYTFVIDPLDGSMNFITGIPYFSVSIALLKNDEPIIAVVYNPTTNDIYYAEKNKGAYLNNKKISVNSESDIEKCSVVYITGYEHPRSYFPKLVSNLDKLKIKRVLVMWSVALDFCLFSQGKIEAIVHNGSELYDRVAGVLIAREAGALVTDFKGNNEFKGDKFLVTNGTGIHNKLLKIV